MVQAVISAVENFALLLVLAFVLASLLSLAQNYSKLAVQTTIGVLFGLTSVISMSILVNLADGVIYDTHAILITLSGPFGGMFAPVIVGAITAGYRLYLGGIGTVPGLVSIVLSVVLGMLLVRFPLDHDRKIRFSKLALCGIVIGVSSVPMSLLLSDKKLDQELLQSLFPSLFINTFCLKMVHRYPEEFAECVIQLDTNVLIKTGLLLTVPMPIR